MGDYVCHYKKNEEQKRQSKEQCLQRVSFCLLNRREVNIYIIIASCKYMYKVRQSNRKLGLIFRGAWT